MSEQYNFPKGPRTPVIVQSYYWLKHVYPFIKKCYQRYGDSIGFHFMGLGKIAMFSNPKDIRAIFTGDPEVFFAGEGNHLLGPLLGDNSLLLLDGKRHLRERRLMLPPFHGERMRHYGHFLQEATDQVSAKWEVQKPFDMHPSLQQISLEVILRVVFGIEESEKLALYNKTITSLLGHLDGLGAAVIFMPFLQKDFGRFNVWGRLLKDLRKLDELIYNELKHHTTESGQDILSMLMAAEYDDGQKMQDKEIRDELLTMLLAGHETTATSLAWALHWLHSDVEIYQKLMDELNSVVDWTPENISHLPYLDAVCKESLRLYPVVPIVARRLKSSCEIGGYRLPKETMVVPCIYLTHQREDLYPNPEKFRPERFLERKFSPYEFLPFGGGVRRCIGGAFATYEMKIVLATILKRFKLKLCNHKVKLKRRSVTIAPDNFKMMVDEIKIDPTIQL